MEKLGQDEIEQRLEQLIGWSRQDDTINREYKFDNFRQAFAFMTHMALISEKLNHHPDWSNSYTDLKISLTTHHSGGLTELDFKWAEAAEKLFS